MQVVMTFLLFTYTVPFDTKTLLFVVWFGYTLNHILIRKSNTMNTLSIVSSDADTDNKTINKSLIEKIKSRYTNEIIIAFSGMMGSGISGMVKTFEKKFKKKGYDTKHLKLSDLIKDKYSSVKNNLSDNYLHYEDLNTDIKKLNYYEYIAVQQSIGNYLREKYSTSILSQYALNMILNNRIGADIHDKDIEEKLQKLIDRDKKETSC